MSTAPFTRGARSVLALGAVVALATACSATGSGGGDGGGATAERELINRAPGGGQPIDNLVWNLPNGEPATLDPRNSATYSAAGVVSNLCDPLLAIDEDYNLSPNLVSAEQVTPTQLVLTLEAEATFWDGTPVTTEDIAYSLERAGAPESVVSFYSANVSGIEVTSDTQVTVNFSAPDVLFTSSLATFGGMVVQKSFAEQAGESFGTSSGGVMCSGPYELEKWSPGDQIDIVRNDDYWNDDVPQLAENVTFEFITDSTASTQAMTTGEVHGSYEIDFAAIPALEKAGSGTLFFGPSMQSVSMNIARPDGPLADQDLRNALQVVIDREELAAAVFHGAAEPHYAFVTPRTWPNDQAALFQESYDDWVEKRAFDLDAAKELVASSSYDGEALKLGFLGGDEMSTKIAQLVQQQTKKAGIEIELAPLQALEFAEAGYDASVRERLGLDFVLSSSFNAAQEPLEPLGFSYLPDAFYNYTGFDNPRVTELITGALGEFDADKRAEMVVEAMNLIEEDASSVNLVSTNTVTFLNNDLGGAITSFAYMSMPAMAFIGANE